MAHFFPAGSRLDVERPPSRTRRTPSRLILRDHASTSASASTLASAPDDDTRVGRPSHINWLQNAAAAQAGPSMPTRPPSARLGRSASLSAIAAPPPLYRHSSLMSNHSLQLDALTGCGAAQGKPLSPISEQAYTASQKRELYYVDGSLVEPSTPVSIGSTYSAFLRRPLKRSISATSTSSLRTNATATHPPTLPPLALSPLDARPAYRAGPQLFSTVYEDAGSERTGSFVTARSVVLEPEPDPDDAAAAAPKHPSGSTTLGAGSADPFVDPAAEPHDDAVPASPSTKPTPRPRARDPASGGTSDTFIWRRWTRALSVGSGLSRPSFSAARRAAAARLPPLPVLLFWAGFVAPWCWLVGGWLVAEGRWEASGRARAMLPLWRPSSSSKDGSKDKGKGKGKGKGKAGAAHDSGIVQEQDVEKGAAAAAAAAPRGRWWAPRGGPGAPVPGGEEKVVTLVKPLGAEVWVYRCRVAAVVSAAMLVAAFIVVLVVVGGAK
ncbi:hypothetical protein BC834DRAFT_968931 [Gloeopeniophorella convolvens]|nr:hypothetical protein BC834DRAFT_968931 [Gloeopeniophorella convolvens]